MTFDDLTFPFERHLARQPSAPGPSSVPSVFGTQFTDHMVTVRYSPAQGWHAAQVVPFGPLELSPASSVLHYGQEIFEGLKAYRSPAGECLLFRPEVNARRFQDSARRLAMRPVPEKLFLTALAQLVEADRAWLPELPGTSLYLRPYLIASEASLTVRPADDYLFGVIACPVGGIPGGTGPMKVWVSQRYSRAVVGGTGTAKCGGNYAASHIAQVEAAEAGCDQVVFLDAIRRRFVEEMGGMNLFFVYPDMLVTPPLTGTILAGVTRDSIIRLAADTGMKVRERPVSFEEWRADVASGRLREAFSCGTAATVASIGAVHWTDGAFTMDADGPVAAMLRDRLLGIQYGRLADPHGWVRRVSNGRVVTDTAATPVTT
jgi:branched-chain amino acid aminotransferase